MRYPSVMVWFGHRAKCTLAPYGAPDAIRDHVLVCDRCMPELQPSCSICKAPAAALGRLGDYRTYSFYYLCDACRARVLQGGNARERRAAVRVRRVQTLLSRHPELAIDEAAPRRTALRGRAHGLRAWITIRDSARQYESARFVLRVETHLTEIDRRAPQPPFRVEPCSPGVALVHDHEATWLAVGFRHLGNADILHVLDVLCSAAGARSNSRREPSPKHP